jgi:magnesium transporter
MDRENEGYDLDATVANSTNPLESKTSQLDDLLIEKLEMAFHKQTSTVVLHDIAKIAAEHSPIDLAYAASRLPPVDRPILYENLTSLSAKVTFMINTDSSTRVSIFRSINDEEVKKLIEAMPPDEAVVILEDISERRFRKVLELIHPSKSARIKEIFKHARNTAGRLMSSDFFAFPMEVTIGEAAAKIRDNPGISLTTKVLVVSASGELQGYVPARNLIINPPTLPLKQVMKAISHSVRVEASREEVIDLVERYKIGALAVVDEKDHPVGIITYEDVIEVIEDIADETIASMAGTTEKPSEHESLFKRFLSRSPWILVTLFAGLINVGVISSFTQYVGPILTFTLCFVPLITGMSGNIGIQCSTVLVRSMALGLISKGNKNEAVLKELAVGMTTAIAFGILCGVLVYFIDFMGLSDVRISPLGVAMIVSVGLTGACLAGTALGVYSPLFFTRLGIDPAVASGPIVIAFNDFLSMSIYFLIAIGVARFFV